MASINLSSEAFAHDILESHILKSQAVYL